MSPIHAGGPARDPAAADGGRLADFDPLTPARVALYGCTVYAPCAEAMAGVCPNCSGELVRRPRG